MKLRIGKKTIQQALESVSSALKNKEQAILLKVVEDKFAVETSSSDLYIGVETKEGLDIAEVGECWLNGKLFTDIIKKGDGATITIESNDKNQIEIKSGNSKFKLGKIKPARLINDNKTFENELTLQTKDFREIIKNTIIATSTSDFRPALQGINFKSLGANLMAYASDSFRVARDLMAVDTELNIDVIVPSENIKTIEKALSKSENVKCGFNTTEANFVLEDDLSKTTILTKLVAGKMPDLEAFFKDYLGGYLQKFVIGLKPLISALERSKLILDYNLEKIIKIDLKRNLAVVSTVDSEIGQAYEEVSANNPENVDEITFAVSIDYLLDALKTLEGETVEISYSSPVKPIILKGDNDTMQLILPVKIKQNESEQ